MSPLVAEAKRTLESLGYDVVRVGSDWVVGDNTCTTTSFGIRKQFATLSDDTLPDFAAKKLREQEGS